MSTEAADIDAIIVMPPRRGDFFISGFRRLTRRTSVRVVPSEQAEPHRWCCGTNVNVTLILLARASPSRRQHCEL